MKFNFKNAIFIFTFSLFIIVFLIYSLASLFIVKKSLDTSFKEKIMVSQDLFADSIKHDILTGFYSEVYRKCKLFYDSGRLESLQVMDSSGIIICSFSSNSIFDPELGFIKTHTFFDEKQTQIASTTIAN